MKKLLLTLSAAILSLPFACAGPLDDLREAFTRASAASYAPNDTITRRFIKYSDHGRANDVLLLQLYMSVHLPEDEVQALLSSISPDGEWSDIDYTDQTRGRWMPTLHLTRLYALTKLYVDPSSSHYRDPRFHEVIHAGINYWLRLDPRCPNWWHNDIGVPKKLTTVLLMLGQEATPGEIEGCLRILKRSAFGRTGQNKVWLAGNNLMKGLLIDDEALVIQSRDIIAEEIRQTLEEGIQPDWSFHQHGPQIQFGNYGLTYADVLSFWCRVLEGSPYMFTDEQYRTIERMITRGICRSVWHGIMDPSFCGRQVFIDAGRGKAYALAVAAQNMAATGRPNKRMFEHIAREIFYPDRYANTLTGADYFYRSDCGIFRTRDWYASIRMHSLRTIGFELTNGENTLANFSADGALLTMLDGAEYENIFACWDWRCVPGTTAYDDGRPIRISDRRDDKLNRSAQVGGATSDDVLCTTMELQRDSLHAFKSNFFFDDLIVALGSDIRSADPAQREIFTTLDQNHLRGDVTVGTSSATTRIAPSEPRLERFLPGELRWVHHDKRGYVLLDDARIRLSTLEQIGKWDAIDPFFQNAVDSARIFKCRIDHTPGTTNSYAYALLPGRTAEQTARFAERPDVEILRNDARCQAIRHKGAVCAVFHQAGDVAFGPYRLAMDVPGIVILKGKRVSVALPTNDRATVTLRKGQQIRTATLQLDDLQLQGKTLHGTLK